MASSTETAAVEGADVADATWRNPLAPAWLGREAPLCALDAARRGPAANAGTAGDEPRAVAAVPFFQLAETDVTEAGADAAAGRRAAWAGMAGMAVTWRDARAGMEARRVGGRAKEGRGQKEEKV